MSGIGSSHPGAGVAAAGALVMTVGLGKTGEPGIGTTGELWTAVGLVAVAVLVVTDGPATFSSATFVFSWYSPERKNHPTFLQT